MEHLKVSVIIPNYNHANHFVQRIDSVINQTYQNIEVIILDDCSTDNSREVIDRYRAHPLVKKIVYNKLNTGSPFLQWKRGVDLAIGDWIWIAESDDYADVHFLEYMVEAIGDRQNVGLAYCDSAIVTGMGIAPRSFATIKNERFLTKRWSEDYSNNGIDEIENFILLGGTINNTSAVLFRRVILEANISLGFPMKYIGDKFTFIRVLSKSDILYVSKVLNFYREPFSGKHHDRLVQYVYEQFIIFHWVRKNLSINRARFFHAFFSNTQISLFRNFNRDKLKIYKSLFGLDSYLLLLNIFYNLFRPFLNLFRRTQKSG